MGLKKELLIKVLRVKSSKAGAPEHQQKKGDEDEIPGSEFRKQEGSPIFIRAIDEVKTFHLSIVKELSLRSSSRLANLLDCDDPKEYTEAVDLIPGTGYFADYSRALLSLTPTLN